MNEVRNPLPRDSILAPLSAPPRTLFSGAWASTIALAALLAGLPLGCTSHDPPTNPDGGTDGGTDDAPPGPGGGIDVPFTNGVSTLAGSPQEGYLDGIRADARFANPVNVAYNSGTLYVADFDNNKLRAIDTVTHDTTTVIAQATFKRPFGLVFAADGTFYASTDNDQAGGHTTMSGSIWKINAGAKTATILANAIGRPRGIIVLPDGRLIATDYQHHVIQIVNQLTGAVTPLAGTWDAPGMVDGIGAAVRFNTPYGLGLRSDGKLIVADYGNNMLRLVSLDGTTSTLTGAITPGYADGTLAAARFNHPQAISIAADGTVFISDTGNFRVRRLVGTAVDTVVGNGIDGYLDNDNLLLAELHGLEGLNVLPDGSMLYIADGNRGDPLKFNSIRQAKLH